MNMTWKCRQKNYHPYIDNYIDDCRNGINIVDNDILLACDLVERKLNNEDVFIDVEKIDKAVELMERYFEISLFDWELFVTALIHCYYKSNDTVVFDEYDIIMGRGNGKNGFISPIGWYLTTHYHGIKGYNVDIIANSEDQAETSFDDIYNVLENFKEKLNKFFYWTKEKILNIITNSYIKYNTSNARTKDGKRSACLIFDEIHEYENYDMMSVFTSGFGKRKHSRIFKISTDGHVREGVIDDTKRLGKDILNGIINDLGILPLFYHITEEREALDPKMWHKANPSLKYLPELQKQMDKEFIQMKYTPSIERDFYTKRMNWPKSNADVAVTNWDNIEATNKLIPNFSGRQAVVGIDYTKINDLASVNIHIKEGDNRYDISHSWLCLQSADLKRLKIPWRQWADEGRLTLVDDVEISPYLLTDYIVDQMQYYNILCIAVDGYRYALLAKALKEIGFDKEHKNLYLVRPSDIMKIVPVIDSIFVNHFFYWDDNPLLRWATNNTKLIASGKKQGTDTGNFYYGKIEGKSRKTDPFMACVHSIIIEYLLDSIGNSETPDYDVVIY